MAQLPQLTLSSALFIKGTAQLKVPNRLIRPWIIKLKCVAIQLLNVQKVQLMRQMTRRPVIKVNESVLEIFSSSSTPLQCILFISRGDLATLICSCVVGTGKKTGEILLVAWNTTVTICWVPIRWSTPRPSVISWYSQLEPCKHLVGVLKSRLIIIVYWNCPM